MAIWSGALEGMVLNPDFWSGKRVLITGHTGFKGSWISLWLQSLGAEIVGYALPPTISTSLFNLTDIDKNMHSVFGDIRDLNNLTQVFNDHKPEIVIHMAAQALVRESYRNPVDTYSTNVMGTVNVLEAIRKTPGIKSVVIITTDKCYENREWFWGYRENEPMGGYDPYSNSKGCAELVSSSYRSSFFNEKDYATHGVAVATARAGNVIGGGDTAAYRLVPDIISAFENGDTVHIRNPHAIRPWQHVLEPLNGYLTLAEHLYTKGIKYAEAWNFGPLDEDAKSVGWIVNKMKEIWGGQANWKIDTAEQPHEAHFLKLDISKARSLLGWEPKLHLGDSLQLIVDWSRKSREGEDLRAFSLEQIHHYQNLS